MPARRMLTYRLFDDVMLRVVLGPLLHGKTNSDENTSEDEAEGRATGDVLSGCSVGAPIWACMHMVVLG